MMRMSGAMNSASSRVTQNGLPSPASISYEGVFNENTIPAEPMDARYDIVTQSSFAMLTSPLTNETELWVAVLLRSRFQKREASRCIDFVIVLDVSGSMDCTLSQGKSRLATAKAAILSLARSALRPADRLGLTTFNNTGTRIFPLTYCKDLTPQALDAHLDRLKAGGGTKLSAGVEVGRALFPPKGTLADRDRRICFLTDMEDSNSTMLHEALSGLAEHDIFTTIVAIGINFNAALTDTITKCRGANYFSVTKQEDFLSTVVEEFDFNFFPCALDVSVSVESPGWEVGEICGVNMGSKLVQSSARWTKNTHSLYPPDFRLAISEFLFCSLLHARRGRPSLGLDVMSHIFGFLTPRTTVVCNVDSLFPSPETDTTVKGGLVMVKMQKKSQTAAEEKAQMNVRLEYRLLGDKKFVKHTYGEKLVTSASKLPSYSHPTAQIGAFLQKYVEGCKYIFTPGQFDLESGKNYVSFLEEAAKLPNLNQEQVALVTTIKKHLGKREKQPAHGALFA